MAVILTIHENATEKEAHSTGQTNVFVLKKLHRHVLRDAFKFRC